jgi:hypothetical protein
VILVAESVFTRLRKYAPNVKPINTYIKENVRVFVQLDSMPISKQELAIYVLLPAVLALMGPARTV